MVGSKTALTGKGKADRFVLVGGRKYEFGTIDAVRFAFQKAIAVVERGIERETTHVSLEHSLVVASGVAMRVVVAVVPHAGKHDVEGSNEMVGNDLIIGVVVKIEELDVALIGTSENKEVVGSAIDFLHVGMAVTTIEGCEGIVEMG